jgi:hypothetical protein
VEFTTLDCPELVNTTFRRSTVPDRSTQIFEQYVMDGPSTSGRYYGLYFAHPGEIAYYIPLHKLLDGGWLVLGTVPIVDGIDPSGQHFPPDMIFYDVSTGSLFTGDVTALGLAQVSPGAGVPLPALGPLGIVFGIVALATTGVASMIRMRSSARLS